MHKEYYEHGKPHRHSRHNEYWAEYIYLLKDNIKDFNQLIIESYSKATEALQDTPTKLEILRKHNVVDAGAKGFVFFLEGMIDFFKHGELKKLASARNVTKIKEFCPP